MNPVETKPEVKKPKTPPRTLAARLQDGAPENRRKAAAILDVLAGGRSATQAAESLGISVARYYALEAKAVEGLMKACEPRPKGRVVPAEKRIAMLQRELERMKRELDRHRTLVRMAQRTVALAAPKPPPKTKRRRKPPIRARKAAAVLRSDPVAAPAAPSMPEGSPTS